GSSGRMLPVPSGSLTCRPRKWLTLNGSASCTVKGFQHIDSFAWEKMMDQAILERVRGIISNLMHVPLDEVTASSSPATLRVWDSLQHLNLILALEEAFGIQFSPEETVQLLDVETIVLLLEEKKGHPR